VLPVLLSYLFLLHFLACFLYHFYLYYLFSLLFSASKLLLFFLLLLHAALLAAPSVALLAAPVAAALVCVHLPYFSRLLVTADGLQKTTKWVMQREIFGHFRGPV
jgi:hypothetical protein